MSIEVGSRYQISQAVQEFLNSAETLTVISNNGVTIQFSLGDAKGHGSMPIEHFQYLLKKSNLKVIPNKKSLINTSENGAEQIS